MDKVGLPFLVLLVLADCTSAGTAPTSTQSPPTIVPPTSAPVPASTAEPPPIYEITFDGGACLSTAPAELPPERYSFVYKITDETIDDLNITLLTEGYTIDGEYGLTK